MNNDIFFFFYNLAHKSIVFDKIVFFVAEILPYIVIVGAFLYVFFYNYKESFWNLKSLVDNLFSKSKELVSVFLGSFVAVLFAIFFKEIIQHLRPFLYFENVIPLFQESGFAFPSGHSTFFMALAISIFMYHKKAGYLFLFFALIIGISRIISGVHFPVDIVGGFVLGGLLAFLITFLYNLFVWKRS